MTASTRVADGSAVNSREHSGQVCVDGLVNLTPYLPGDQEIVVAARRKPAEEVKVPPPPATGTGVNIRAFHQLMTKRFPKILAELAK